jgi:DNA end-binding protein Ku
MAKQLVETLATSWQPEQYKDEHREKLLAMIERKAAGEDVAVQPAQAEAAPVPDLMSALKASLDAVRSRDDDDGAAPAKKPTAKKKPAAGTTRRKATAKSG